MNVSVGCGEEHTSATPNITDNEDLNPRVDYTDTFTEGCALIRTWTATDSAGNMATGSQYIVYSNPLPPVITSPAEINVACGDIESVSDNLAHNRIFVRHPCGRPVSLQYTDSTALTQCGFNFTRVWQVTDDCGQSVSFSQVVRVLDQQLPGYPHNRAINIDINAPLMWPQYPGAVAYQVFLWRESTGERPIEPVTVISARTFYPTPHYPPGTRMLWQIEYILGVNNTIPSPIWSFETEPLPDLEIIVVNVPEFAFSGQSFDVAWTVVNSGSLSVTSFIFYDDIYLSRSATAIVDGRRVKRVTQRRFLDPNNDGYTYMTEINLRNNDVGVFYVIVITDATNAVSPFFPVAKNSTVWTYYSHVNFRYDWTMTEQTI